MQTKKQTHEQYNEQTTDAIKILTYSKQRNTKTTKQAIDQTVTHSIKQTTGQANKHAIKINQTLKHLDNGTNKETVDQPANQSTQANKRRQAN